MKIEVINTGTELLLGNVVNAHAAYFGRTLFPLGLRVARQTTIPDGAPIRRALIEAFPRCDVLLVTGGLGPTTDDVTREIVAELLARGLIENLEIRAAIEARCLKRGFAFQPRMERQTFVPEGAEILWNAFGTAPGLYLPADESSPSYSSPHIFLLPGPPRELHPMFESFVVPILEKLTGMTERPVCKTFRCVGIGESMVESKIGLELSTQPGLEIGYCARPNEVDFRLIGSAAAVDPAAARVRDVLGEFILTEEGESLEAVIVRMLREHGQTIAVAESCTGGSIANRLTNVPGASAVFLAGWVTYANAAKISQLAVDPKVLAEDGAVSEAVALQMAVGARAAAGSTYAVATTGIAGPSGGTSQKPVGTVCFGLAGPGDAVAWTECFPTDRETFKMVATNAILNRLRLRIGDLQPDSQQ